MLLNSSQGGSRSCPASERPGPDQHSITCTMFGQSRPIKGPCEIRRDRAVIYSTFLRSELGAYTGREGSDGDHLWRWQTTTSYAELQRKRLKTFVALSSRPTKGLTCLKLTIRKKVSLEKVVELPRHFSQPASSSLQAWWEGLQASIHFPAWNLALLWNKTPGIYPAVYTLVRKHQASSSVYHAYSSIIHNSPNVEVTHISIERWMDTQKVIYT